MKKIVFRALSYLAGLISFFLAAMFFLGAFILLIAPLVFYHPFLVSVGVIAEWLFVLAGAVIIAIIFSAFGLAFLSEQDAQILRGKATATFCKIRVLYFTINRLINANR